MPDGRETKSGPAFNKAADARSEWRERQKAALDAGAQREFARIREDTERKKREAQKRFWDAREEMVEAEKAKLLLQKPGFALRMFPVRQLRESMAYGKAADMVRRGQQHVLDMLESECREREDAFLKEQEREREALKMREQFKSRAALERGRGLSRNRDDDDRSR